MKICGLIHAIRKGADEAADAGDTKKGHPCGAPFIQPKLKLWKMRR